MDGSLKARGAKTETQSHTASLKDVTAFALFDLNRLALVAVYSAVSLDGHALFTRMHTYTHTHTHLLCQLTISQPHLPAQICSETVGTLLLLRG